SAGFTTTLAGTYHWTANYVSSNVNNSNASSSCADEPVVVGPASPAISTTPSAGGTVGVTLNDSANLTGGFNPMGKITFNLYGPADTRCTGSVLFTHDVSSLLAAPPISSAGFTTALAGTYHWTASYVSSDVNNTSVSSACADEPVV